MPRTSSGPSKRQPQKHQNTTAWKPNTKTGNNAKILALPVNGLCRKCTDIILWRKQNSSYKPLTVPKRCQICQEKSVKAAYHVICDPCAEKTGVCAKCREKQEIVSTGKEKSQAELERMLQQVLTGVPERRKRTIVRKLERGDLEYEEAIKMATSLQRDDDFDFDDEDFDDDDEESEDDSDDSEESDEEPPVKPTAAKPTAAKPSQPPSKATETPSKQSTKTPSSDSSDLDDVDSSEFETEDE